MKFMKVPFASSQYRREDAPQMICKKNKIGETRKKSWICQKSVPVLPKPANLGRQCRQLMARRRQRRAHRQRLRDPRGAQPARSWYHGIGRVTSEFPVGLACHGSSSEHVEENETSLRTGGRFAPLRMGVRRAAPSSQVLLDFGVISCPWRAAWASADQGSLSGPLLEKETQRFFG